MEKELYYTENDIDDEALRFLSEVASLNKGGIIPFRKKAAALLVLDMQRYFLEPSSHAFIPSAPAIVPRVVGLALAFSRAGLPVFLTRHVNTTADAGSMARWWGDLPREEDGASELIEPLAGMPAAVIRKSQYDAFLGTALETELRGRGVKQVVVCGVMTHLCCDATARSAFARGFDVFFTVDGTATYTSAFHRASLRCLAHGCAVPVTAEQILGRLG